MTIQPLDMWVVYDHPSDFPDVFVARRWEILREERPTADVLKHSDLDMLRHMIATDKHCSVQLARSPEDDPRIVEVWT